MNADSAISLRERRDRPDDGRAVAGALVACHEN